jgi:hypothetical protein
MAGRFCFDGQPAGVYCPLPFITLERPMPETRPFYGWTLLAALSAIVSINMGMNYAAAGVIIAPIVDVSRSCPIGS